MFKSLEIFQMSQSMARHAAARQAVVARNMANADTPGYVARDLISFQNFISQHAEPASQFRASRTRHLDGQRTGGLPAPQRQRTALEPNGNGVSLETEMMKAVEVKRQHDRALTIYRSALDIMRMSIGRR